MGSRESWNINEERKRKRGGFRGRWDGVQVNEKRIDDAAIPSKNWDGRCSEEIVRDH